MKWYERRGQAFHKRPKTGSFDPQPFGKFSVRGHLGCLIGGINDHARPGASRFLYIAHRGIVNRDLAAVPGLRELGGQNGGFVQALEVGLVALRPQDDVGAVNLLSVKPDIPLARQLAGE